MLKKFQLFVMSLAIAMVIPSIGIGYAATGERSLSFACSFLQDIHKGAEAQVSVEECLKCLCLFQGETQTGWKVVYSWAAPLTDFDDEQTCDDGIGQADFAFITDTRFVRVLPDGCDPLGVGASQCDCIRGKEDLQVVIFDSDGRLSFLGGGIGVVGVGITKKGDDCCNIDEGQAILHLRGNRARHDKKKCWARLDLLSIINPLDNPLDGGGPGPDGLDPCDIQSVAGQFEFNGMEGCLCDSSSRSRP